MIDGVRWSRWKEVRATRVTFFFLSLRSFISNHLPHMHTRTHTHVYLNLLVILRFLSGSCINGERSLFSDEVMCWQQIEFVVRGSTCEDFLTELLLRYDCHSRDERSTGSRNYLWMFGESRNPKLSFALFLLRNPHKHVFSHVFEHRKSPKHEMGTRVKMPIPVCYTVFFY